MAEKINYINEIAQNIEKLARDELSLEEKNALITKIKNMRIGEIDKLANIKNNPISQSTLLKPIVERFPNYPGYSVSKFCNALYEVNNAVKNQKLLENVRKKYKDAFVNVILIEVYFKQGKFDKFTDAMLKDTSVEASKYSAFATLFNNYLKKDRQFLLWLVGPANLNSKVTNLSKEILKPNKDNVGLALDALRRYYKLEDNATPLQIITTWGEKGWNIQQSKINEEKKDKTIEQKKEEEKPNIIRIPIPF